MGNNIKMGCRCENEKNKKPNGKIFQTGEKAKISIKLLVNRTIS
jgi:hypothetical protein